MRVRIFFYVTVVCSYICCLLVKRAGRIGGAGNSDDESESGEGEGEAGGADS
jgi:hypothetical protein